jgi:hypothetical protein
MRVQRSLVSPGKRIECADVALPRAVQIIHHVICDILATQCRAWSVGVAHAWS